MRGEGLLYGLAFAAILGGAALLLRPGAPAPARQHAEPREPRPAPRPAPRGTPLADAAVNAPRTVVVEVGGPGGRLRGPLRPIVGPSAVERGTAEGGRVRVELASAAGEVAFGATGHQWLRREAASLANGEVLVLPVAAPALVVEVREPDGSPAVDVPVEVVPAAPGAPRRTDAGGSVVLDDLAPGLVVVRAGGRERVAAPVPLEAGRDLKARIVLEPALEVTGRVVGPDGAPLEGARLEAFAARGPIGRAVSAGADGRFRLRLPVEAVVALRASWTGLATEAVEVRPAQGTLAVDTGDVRLREREVEVAGRVRGGAGRTDARVSVEPAVAALVRELSGGEWVLLPSWSVPLEPDGSYVLRGLPHDVPLRVSLRGAGLPEDALLVPRGGDRVRRDFEPLAGETLRVVVTDGVGGPAVAGQVVLLGTEVAEGDVPLAGERVVVTDAEGRLTVEGLTPGPWYLRGYRPARRSLLARVDLPAAGERALAFLPALTDPSRRLHGAVLDDLGRPLEGVSVRAAGVATVSGAGGAFVLDGVESLTTEVEVSFGYEPGSRAPDGTDVRAFPTPGRARTVPGAGALSLVLARGQALRLRALDGLDDTPLAWLRAVVRDDEGRVHMDRTLAAVDGVYHLSGLPRHGLRLTLLTPGRRLERLVPYERATATADAGALRDLGDLRLVRGLALEGVVTDPEGTPLPDARAALLGPGWLATLRAGPALRRELDLRVVQADTSGRVRLEGVDPSTPAAVVVWAPGFAPTVRRAAFTAPVVVEEAPKPTASGKAEEPSRPSSGLPLDPLELKIEEARPLERLEARIDAQLKRGSRVSVVLSDLASREAVHGAVLDLESARNGSALLDLVLRGIAGGQAASTQELRDVGAHLLQEEREPGVYGLGPVEPGEYELVIEHPQYEPVRRKIPVLDPGTPFSFHALEPEAGARLDPKDPAALARVRTGEEMVAVYGSDRMRIPLALKRR